MPSIAIAASVFIDQGFEEDYVSFMSTLHDENCFSMYQPKPEQVERLEKLFSRFIKIYPTIETLYNN